MKKVLILGGLGYVGQALIDRLQSHNDLQISVLDTGLCGGLVREDIDFILGDIRDEYLLKNTVPRYDVIVHLAGIVGEPACSLSPEFAFDVNVRGTSRLIDAMLPQQHLIYASSTSVYGNRSNECVYEDSYVQPINHYAQQKVHCEQLITYKVKQYTILRPATAFGLTRNPRLDVLINTLIYEALTKHKITLYEPNIIRPMIYVYDYAKALEMAIDDQLGRGEVYNLGDPGLTMTKEKLVNFIAERCHVPIEYSNETSLDQRNYDVSFEKLIRTGFTCTYGTLQDTIIEMSDKIQTITKNEKLYNRAENIKNYLTNNIWRI